MMYKRWSLAVHHEDRTEDSLISENHFVHFVDVHATMKKNKGKMFVVRIPTTAKRMEIQAIHNLKNLGYVVETR
jgi:nitrate reductase NapAB chaperone NapD